MASPLTGVYTYSTNRTILAQKWGESIRHQPISDCRQMSEYDLNGLLVKRQNDNLSPGVVTEEN